MFTYAHVKWFDGFVNTETILHFFNSFNHHRSDELVVSPYNINIPYSNAESKQTHHSEGVISMSSKFPSMLTHNVYEINFWPFTFSEI